MVQHLHGIYLAQDGSGANRALGAFLEPWEAAPFPEFEKVVSALVNWGEKIFAFCEADPITNGHLEGRTNKIGVLKHISGSAMFRSWQLEHPDQSSSVA